MWKRCKRKKAVIGVSGGSDSICKLVGGAVDEDENVEYEDREWTYGAPMGMRQAMENGLFVTMTMKRKKRSITSGWNAERRNVVKMGVSVVAGTCRTDGVTTTTKWW